MDPNAANPSRISPTPSATPSRTSPTADRSAAALSIRGFTKTYKGGFTAVENLDLEVPDGAFFGLLGPNGAGKTTMIGAVCNLVRPTAGSIQVFGHEADSREARRLVGLAEQDINLDRFLNVDEVLIYHAGFFGMGRAHARRRANELMDIFDLSGKAKVRPPALSGGMRRRLLFARALMHEPRLLILDEPTAGVDVELRSELWEYTRRLHEAGTTILLTTHYLEEAEALCEEIALIRGGRIIARDTADGLRAQYGASDISEVYLRAMADAADDGIAATGAGSTSRVSASNGSSADPATSADLVTADGAVSERPLPGEQEVAR